MPNHESDPTPKHPEQHPPPAANPPLTTSRFRVAAMDCGAEEQLVRMQLADLDGIDRVDVDLTARTVEVHHRGSSGRIATALAQLGLGADHLGDDDARAEAVTGQQSDDTSDSTSESARVRRQRRALIVALAINAGFFVGELAAGLLSGSMGLVADALDMGADASVYALSLVAVGTAAARQRHLARRSGQLQAVLAVVGLAEVVRRVFVDGEPPDTTAMIVLSLLALAGNVTVLVVLQRVRSDEAHLQASWIFTANDVKVNLLVIAAAIGVAATGSAIPDLIAGAIIFAVVAGGARRILRISR